MLGASSAAAAVSGHPEFNAGSLQDRMQAIIARMRGPILECGRESPIKCSSLLSRLGTDQLWARQVLPLELRHMQSIDHDSINDLPLFGQPNCPTYLKNVANQPWWKVNVALLSPESRQMAKDRGISRCYIEAFSRTRYDYYSIRFWYGSLDTSCVSTRPRRIFLVGGRAHPQDHRLTPALVQPVCFGLDVNMRMQGRNMRPH